MQLKKKLQLLKENVFYQVPEIDVSTLAKMVQFSKKFQQKNYSFMP